MEEAAILITAAVLVVLLLVRMVRAVIPRAPISLGPLHPPRPARTRRLWKIVTSRYTHILATLTFLNSVDAVHGFVVTQWPYTLPVGLVATGGWLWFEVRSRSRATRRNS